jgi:two-component system nitrate/nitrite response regulator NarL
MIIDTAFAAPETSPASDAPAGSVKTVLICDTQPVAIEGMRFLINQSGGLRCVGAVTKLDAALALIPMLAPSAIVLDKGLGIHTVMDWLHHLGTSLGTSAMAPAAVVWGTGITEAEALKFLQAGARGIVRRTSEPESLLTCLRAVTSGSTWMEDGIFGNVDRIMQPRRSQLTPREVQIAELVEQGLRNRDIGRQLGIQTGTVKIHLKHIFEKTGVRGRYGLALTGLREKGTLSLPPM